MSAHLRGAQAEQPHAGGGEQRGAAAAAVLLLHGRLEALQRVRQRLHVHAPRRQLALLEGAPHGRRGVRRRKGCKPPLTTREKNKAVKKARTSVATPSGSSPPEPNAQQADGWKGTTRREFVELGRSLRNAKHVRIRQRLNALEFVAAAQRRARSPSPRRRAAAGPTTRLRSAAPAARASSPRRPRRCGRPKGSGSAAKRRGPCLRGSFALANSQHPEVVAQEKHRRTIRVSKRAEHAVAARRKMQASRV